MARRNRSQQIHRDRAKARHRSDRSPSSTADVYAQLRAFLADYEWSSEPPLGQLDLTDYLQRTDRLELSAGERLRQLAIEVEHDFIAHAYPQGWLGMARIYDLAALLESDNSAVLHSRGLTAMRCADRCSIPTFLTSLLNEARQSLTAAIEQLPDDACYLSTMGELHYLHSPSSTAEEALSWYERALACDPTWRWALLYRAHCLHDLERWSEAVAAYDLVNPADFQGPPSWRMHLLIEQRGTCRLNAGDLDGALADFETILTRYEETPGLCAANPGTLPGSDLIRAATTPLRAQLHARVRALLQTHEEPSSVAPEA